MRGSHGRGFGAMLLRGLVMLVACLLALPACAQQFRTGNGLPAMSQGATGVYELGWIRLGASEILVEALLHNGAILQVHSRNGAYWLAKRAGSRGGRNLPPTKFDELAQVAGGMNRDVGAAASDVQRRFALAADLFGTSATGSAAVRPIESNPCALRGCRVIYPGGAGGAAVFRISVSDDDAVWGFEGYGIVAVWGMPQ